MTPAQKKLVEQYMPFAERVACRFAKRNPRESLDDVKADALFGLCLAGERFDVERADDRGPASFPAYAISEVLGSILAGVRFRRNGQQVPAVDEQGEPVSLDDLAAESRLTAEDLAELNEQVEPLLEDLRRIRSEAAPGSGKHSPTRARLYKQIAKRRQIPEITAVDAVNRAVELLDEIERDKASCN